MENELGCFQSPFNQMNKSNYQCFYSDVITSDMCKNYCITNGINSKILYQHYHINSIWIIEYIKFAYWTEFIFTRKF